MSLKLKIVAGLSVAALLTGCGSIDSAAYMIGGMSTHSLSLTRTKTFAWDKSWELTLVTARNPECMRRHKLQPVTDADFKVEVYRSLEGNYIVKQGTNWYVTETQQCRLQQFKTPPREPGDLVGTFEPKEEGIRFVPAPAAIVPPPAAITASQASSAPPGTTQEPPPAASAVAGAPPEQAPPVTAPAAGAAR